MSLPPAAVLPFATTSTDLTLLTGPFILRGWAFKETTGSAAATFELYDGPDDTTVLVVPINLATSESTRDWLTGNGIIIRTGLFLEMLTGSIKGTIWYTPIINVSDVAVAQGEWGDLFVRPGA